MPFDNDDIAINRATTTPLSEFIERRLTRRQMLKTTLAAGATIAGVGVGGSNFAQAAPPAAAKIGSTLRFDGLRNVITKSHRVSPGHRAAVLIRWGDPVMPDAPTFDPHHLTAAAQAKQFGYNNDYVAFLPLPFGSNASDRGLLCVNHEYVNPELMWAGLVDRMALTEEQTRVEMMAHGHSVVEVRREAGQWRVVPDSAYNRRVTADSPMLITGPAAGHVRMRTTADPTGTRVLGTLNNCAGGVTPWGTVLIAEENIHKYFVGDLAKTPEAAALKRYGFNDPDYCWGKYDERFDVEKQPHEPNRFGWIVEFNPWDPQSVPIKRTALGRFKHEGADAVISSDGRLVVYSGDDQAYEYVYRYLSNQRVNIDKPTLDHTLLDDGTLYVARFTDHICRWLPLIHGQGPLTVENGFASQADVLIEARRAADLVGATPMDRPEDVEHNAATGKVYIMLTNNAKRKPDEVDGVNDRANNRYGHIIELLPPGWEKGDPRQTDHTAERFGWALFLKAGNPAVAEHGAKYHPDVDDDGWLASPDNVAFDAKGRMWITTDQGTEQRRNGIPDGVRVCETQGDGRALTKLFFACPIGAEMCGPAFTPDNTTLFLAVQHPGEGDGASPSTFEKPWTRWPDFDDKTPPRPAIVVVTREADGPIGG